MRSGDPPRATLFSFTLRQAATVKLTFSSTQRGRSVDGFCEPLLGHSGRDRRCTYQRTIGALTISAHAGANGLSFTGHLARGRTLRPGRYQLSLSAWGAGSRSGATRRLSFTILP